MTAILVAEDDPVICDLLTVVLETELSATVRCERTGSLALQAIETAGFDLAIIDVNMPEISGYELARRAANRNIPTLLSSGHPDADIKLKEHECPYLAKPYRVSDLISKAAEAITQADENIRCIKASLAKLVVGPPNSIEKPDFTKPLRSNSMNQASCLNVRYSIGDNCPLPPLA